MVPVGVAVPLCLMWRAFVAGVGDTNSGTTIGPATPTGAWWMCPATNVSRFLLLICFLNWIVPLLRTLIRVWPLATEFDPVVSFFAVSFAWRSQSWSGAQLTDGRDDVVHLLLGVVVVRRKPDACVDRLLGEVVERVLAQAD